MFDAELFPITQAAAELMDISMALKNQDEAWFHGNQPLGDYYDELSQQLNAFLAQHREAV